MKIYNIILKIFLVLLVFKLTFQIKINSEIPTKKSKAPFYDHVAISLAKDLSYLIVNKEGYNDTYFASNIGACFSILNRKKNNFTSQLSSFWSKMAKAYGANSIFNSNDFTDDIADSMTRFNIKSNGKTVNCGVFLSNVINVNPSNKTKVFDILGKEEYFGSFKFNDAVQMPFITGIVGTRRNLLPANAFGILNGLAK